MVAAAMRLPPRPGEQVRGAQEHRGAIVERRCRPIIPGGDRRLDRGFCVGVVGIGERAQPGGVTVRLHDVDALACAQPVRTVDHVRQFDRVSGQPVQRRGQLGPLGAAGGIVVHRLVDRYRNLDDRVHTARIADHSQ